MHFVNRSTGETRWEAPEGVDFDATAHHAEQAAKAVRGGEEKGDVAVAGSKAKGELSGDFDPTQLKSEEKDGGHVLL